MGLDISGFIRDGQVLEGTTTGSRVKLFIAVLDSEMVQPQKVNCASIRNGCGVSCSVSVVWRGVMYCWCGVVWGVMVWCGVVWCGVMYCHVVLVWSGVVWGVMVWCGVVSCSVGMEWHGVALCRVWFGVVWGVVWHDEIL